jgi:hypothetical protein
MTETRRGFTVMSDAENFILENEGARAFQHEPDAMARLMRFKVRQIQTACLATDASQRNYA